MPFITNFDIDNEIVFIQGKRPVDTARCLQLVDEVHSHAQYHSRFNIMIDMRDCGFLPTTQEIRQIAAYLGCLRSRYLGCVSLLVSGDFGFGLARMMCAFAEHHGFSVMPFSDHDEALNWVLRQREHAGEEG